MTVTPLTHVITLQPSGLQFTVQPSESLLAAAIRQDISLPYSCRNGSCGSCKCRTLEGTVEQGPHSPRALSAKEAENGWVLACCSVAQGDVQLLAPQAKRGWTPPVRKLALRVHAMQQLAPDVMQLELHPLVAQRLEYLAGQYYEVLLRDGSRRAYSVASAPTQDSAGLLLHIRHLPGGLFSDQVFGSLKVGHMLRMEGPLGGFGLQEESERPIVLLATGTGFAPLQAMLERLQQLASTRPIHFYWGGRRPQDLYAHRAVLAQCNALPTLHYIPVLSGAQPDDDWRGRIGHVHQAVLEDFSDLSEYEVYACGSPAMVSSARHSLTTQCHLPPGQFFADAFISQADTASTEAPVLAAAA